MDPISSVTTGSASSYSSTTTLSVTSTTTTTSSSSAVMPTDTYTPSGNAPSTTTGSSTSQDATAAQKAKDAGWAGVNMKQFQADLNAKLLEQIKSSQQSLKDAGVAFYGGPEGPTYDLKGADTSKYTDAQMGVGQDWGADATSQRIVDFALAFRGQAKGMSDEDFIKKIKGAIDEGFKQARGDVGDVPGPTGQLVNDTYKATMDKLDKALKDLQDGSKASTTDPISSAITAATAKNATKSASSSLSILA